MKQTTKELIVFFAILVIIGLIAVLASPYIPNYHSENNNSFGITPSGQPGIKVGPVTAPADGSNPSVGISP